MAFFGDADDATQMTIAMADGTVLRLASVPGETTVPTAHSSGARSKHSDSSGGGGASGGASGSKPGSMDAQDGSTATAALTVAPTTDTGRQFSMQAARCEDIMSEVLALKPLVHSAAVRIDGVLGRGAFGCVFQGALGDDAVAVKMQLSGVMSIASLREFANEAKILSRLRHPNVLSWRGVAVFPGRGLALLTPFAPGGDLHTMIHGRPADGVAPQPLTAARRLELARGITAGLRYVHSVGLVHCDIKPKNILLSASGEPQLADFGGAYVLAGARESRAHTVAYAAPEVLLGGASGTASDVFAFGVLAAELCAGPGQLAPRDRDNLFAHPREWNEALRGVDTAVERVVAACWDSNVSARPSAAVLHLQFTSLLARAEGKVGCELVTCIALDDEVNVLERLRRDDDSASVCAEDAHEGWTVLDAACARGMGSVVDTLLAKRRALDNYGTSSVANAVALAMGHTGEVSDRLLAALTTPTPPVPSTLDAADALWSATMSGRTASIRAVLDLGTDVSACGVYGSTALHLAAARGDLEATQLLLERGCPLIPLDFENQTALECAAARGHNAVVRVILERQKQASDAATATGDETPHSPAAAVRRNPPLARAAESGQVDVVRTLLDFDVPINAADARGLTPLILASWEGHVETVDALITAGADLTHRLADGTSPLLVAAQEGHLGVVQSLLRSKVGINDRLHDGTTALYMACQEGKETVVACLLWHGADTALALEDGTTCLYISAQEGHAEICLRLIQARADVNATDRQGATALYVAAQTGNLAVVKLLLEHGANVASANNAGAQALHAAATEGELAVVKHLAQHGAHLDALKHDGTTAAALATIKGHAAVVEYLVRCGATVHVLNTTLLALAERAGHEELIKWLREWMAEHSSPLHLSPAMLRGRGRGRRGV